MIDTLINGVGFRQDNGGPWPISGVVGYCRSLRCLRCYREAWSEVPPVGSGCFHWHNLITGGGVAVYYGFLCKTCYCQLSVGERIKLYGERINPEHWSPIAAAIWAGK